MSGVRHFPPDLLCPFLKQGRYGTATFIPINKIKPRDPESTLKLTKKPGSLGLAIDLIDFNPQFQKVFSYVFGSTLVVENIETAREIGIGKARMVTLDGDLTENSGAMQGGFRQKRRMGGFSERELTSDIEKNEAQVFELESSISTF